MTPCQQLLKTRFGEDVGTDRWWRRVAVEGCPVVSAIGRDRALVLFLWRDPQGDETHSTTRCVYIDIPSITNHHNGGPVSLERIPATDVWHWSFEVEADWRGSYCFIPVDDLHLPPGSNGAKDEIARPNWWRSLLKLAQPDPLNSGVSHVGLRGQRFSAAHLPQSPFQTAWRDVDRKNRAVGDQSRLQEIAWNSAHLENSRRVWIYRTGATVEEKELPVVLLLDGQYWAEAMPVFSALDNDTQAEWLPPAVYVLIDSLDEKMRAREVACNEAFWEAIEQELLLLAASLTPCTRDPRKTVVAGQSFGGLAALFAGLRSPERFGCVLSQSGSFWWPGAYAPQEMRLRLPDIHGAARDVAADLIEDSKSAASRLRVFLEAGSFEKVIGSASERIHHALIGAGHDARYRVYAGGHDPLCWRGGLLDGLSFLLAENRAPSAEAAASQRGVSSLAISDATE